MANLEQEIKHSGCKNFRESALVNFMFTHSWFQSRVKPMFKEHGITNQQYNVLKILRGRHPGSAAPNEIKDAMIDSSPDLTRLIDRLVSKELVNRSLNAENRRCMSISISSKGMEKLTEVDKLTQAIVEELLGQVPEKKLEIFNEVLNQMRR